jgi:hypothetical protein
MNKYKIFPYLNKEDKPMATIVQTMKAIQGETFDSISLLMWGDEIHGAAFGGKPRNLPPDAVYGGRGAEHTAA